MQKLVPMFQRLAGTIGELRIDRLTILPSGGSDSSSGLGTRIVDANEQIKAATGVDLTKTLRDKLGEEHSPPPLPRAPIRPPAR
jgi:flotillin